MVKTYAGSMDREPIEGHTGRYEGTEPTRAWWYRSFIVLQTKRGFESWRDEKLVKIHPTRNKAGNFIDTRLFNESKKLHNAYVYAGALARQKRQAQRAAREAAAMKLAA